MYSEYPPPEPLAPFVECYWRRELTEAVSDTSGVILPDGRVDVVWVEGGRTLIAGPQTRVLPRPLEAPFLAVGARFHPGVGPALLGLPAHQLLDTHVPLEAIDTRPARLLSHRLAAIERVDAFSVFGAALGRLAGEGTELDPVVRAAVGLLDRPQATVGGLVAEVALSERQLQRRFHEWVGYGPKTLQRVLRFQRVLTELERPHADSGGLARIAAATGYADQAHLAREIRRLSGFTPVQLARFWVG